MVRPLNKPNNPGDNTQSSRYEPLSQTVNVNLARSKLTQTSPKEKSECLNISSPKRKHTDSLLLGLSRKPGQNFKLRCHAKEQGQQYQGQCDQTEFSLLELERQTSKRGPQELRSLAAFKGSRLEHKRPQ